MVFIEMRQTDHYAKGERGKGAAEGRRCWVENIEQQAAAGHWSGGDDYDGDYGDHDGDDGDEIVDKGNDAGNDVDGQEVNSEQQAPARYWSNKRRFLKAIRIRNRF